MCIRDSEQGKHADTQLADREQDELVFAQQKPVSYTHLDVYKRQE